MSYRPTQADAYRRAGNYAARSSRARGPANCRFIRPPSSSWSSISELRRRSECRSHRVAIARRRGHRMMRREFITLLGGAAAGPLAARAQQAAMPVIGFLGTASASAWSGWVPAFTQRLRELGWIEGHTLAIEYRWAEGREERYPEALAEFVRLKVDVLVMGGAALPAAKRATSIIPIVFTLAGDPVRSGAVASLARPGGNVTGLSSSSARPCWKKTPVIARNYSKSPSVRDPGKYGLSLRRTGSGRNSRRGSDVRS